MTSSTPHPTWAQPDKIPPLSQEDLETRLVWLKDLRVSDFQAWRHHPVSRVVLRFLEDYRDERLREAIDAWMAGGLTALQEGEGRGRALLANELAVLSFEDVLRFYGVVPVVAEEEEN